MDYLTGNFFSFFFLAGCFFLYSSALIRSDEDETCF